MQYLDSMQIAGIFSALGLSGAAGLNAYVPLLLVAVLARFGVVSLTQPYDVIASTWAIVVISILLVIEVIVDKVPGADHINDLVQTFVRPTAGAVLFAASSGVIGDAHPAAFLIAGLMIAFGVHAAKTTARPVVNMTTFGVGAPVVSTIEDVAALGTSLLAVFAPFVVGVAVLLFVVAVIWVIRARRAKARAHAARHP